MRVVEILDIGPGHLSYDPYGGPSQFRKTNRGIVAGSIVGEYVGPEPHPFPPNYEGEWPVPGPPPEPPTTKQELLDQLAVLKTLIQAL